VKPCPSCGADAGAPRVGSLGESKGVWCKACGETRDTLEAWENAYRADPNHVWGGTMSPVWSLPATHQPTPTSPYAPSAARKLFNNRKHGPLIQSCPGVDMLPLIDVDAIPDDMLGVILDHVFNETWTDATAASVKRDRIRELVT
jgi:hypothetical protein